jgi:hypothetical protein
VNDLEATLAAQTAELRAEVSRLQQELEAKQQWLDSYVLDRFDGFLKNGQSGEDATHILKDLGLNKLLEARNARGKQHV